MEIYNWSSAKKYMQQAQREMFSKGLIDVANLCMAALVFGQLTGDKTVDIGRLVLGVLFWLISYIGAFSMSLDRSTLQR
jgi:hypothetical protein